MGIFGIPLTPAPQFYKLSDWGEPVPQRTLKQLGLPARYAVERSRWPLIESGDLLVSNDSYPFTNAIAGESYAAAALWMATPAFSEHYDSPVEMLWHLLHPEP
jgi:hypothetical protein